MNKTTIIIATYKGDPHATTAADALESLGYKNYRLVDPTQKLTFAQNNNKGAKESSTEYVLFLNSDTIPTIGFLEEMEKILDANPVMGIVGARLYFVDNVYKIIKFNGGKTTFRGQKDRIQHAGIGYNDRMLPIEVGLNSQIDNPQVMEGKTMGGVTGACMLVRRQEFLDLGGFDEEFKNGWEDTDLCLRYLLDLKKLSYYQPKALVGHYHSGSENHGRFDNEDNNYNYWCKKWHSSGLIYDLFYGTGDVRELDLGCGNNKRPGFFGIDKIRESEADLVFNLETIHENGFNLPFGDSKLNEVNCSDILHLIANPIEVINEVHRILKPDGWVYIIVPHAFSWSGFASPFTKHYFTPETFLNYFASGSKAELEKLDPEMAYIKPWHIEMLDAGLLPNGIDPFSVPREIIIKMRPLKDDQIGKEN